MTFQLRVQLLAGSLGPVAAPRSNSHPASFRDEQPATRWPTGPVPARTVAVVPASDKCRPATTTAAAAVALAPLASIITDTRKGPKNVPVT